jgi:hypothetical protein
MKCKILFLVCALLIVNLFPQEVKSKIGVMLKSGDQINRLKTIDRAKVGDQLRIFVQPQTECYVYVIFSDTKESNLLNFKTGGYKIKKESKLTLPSSNEYYEFDNQSTKAYLTIFCSPSSLNELENLFKNKSSIEHKKWIEAENLITKNNQINLNNKTEKPISIAGNVRSLNDDFQNKLQLFSDKKLILKRFEIEIKK